MRVIGNYIHSDIHRCAEYTEMDPRNGGVIGSKFIGGRFGIVNPMIVGGMVYLANAWNWVTAVPVSEVNPNYEL